MDERAETQGDDIVLKSWLNLATKGFALQAKNVEFGASVISFNTSCQSSSQCVAKLSNNMNITKICLTISPSL